MAKRQISRWFDMRNMDCQNSTRVFIPIEIQSTFLLSIASITAVNYSAVDIVGNISRRERGGVSVSRRSIDARGVAEQTRLPWTAREHVLGWLLNRAADKLCARGTCLRVYNRGILRIPATLWSLTDTCTFRWSLPSFRKLYALSFSR